MSATETVERTPEPDNQPGPGADEQVKPQLGDPQPDQPQAEGHDGHRHGPSLNPELTREVTVEVPAEEVTRTFRSVVNRYRKQARIPGFRPGKVPESLIRKRFADGIRQDVVEAVLPGHFRTAIDEKSFKPVSQPQVTDLKLDDGQPLSFKAVFEVLPEFSVDGYRDVKVEKPATSLTEDEYAAELDRVRDAHSTMEPVTEDRTIADGDWAQITFTGTMQGETEGDEAKEPIRGEEVPVEIGGKHTLAAFNDALRGTKPGQELKFEAAYPEEYDDKRLAGKTVAYDVKVTAIKKKVQPELDDEFAKELDGDYAGIEDFKTKLREYLTSSKGRRIKNETEDKLMSALIERFQFPVPEALVQDQVDKRLDRGLRALAAQGMKTDDMRKLDFARLRAAQHDSAVNDVKATLILDRIAAAEKVEVTDKELDDELEVLSYQSREPLDQMRTRLTREGALDRIREQLRREKAADVLYNRLA